MYIYIIYIYIYYIYIHIHIYIFIYIYIYMYTRSTRRARDSVGFDGEDERMWVVRGMVCGRRV